MQTTHWRLHTADYTIKTLQYTLHNEHYKLDTTDYKVYTADCTLRTIQWRQDTTHCTLNTTDYTLHNENCTLHNTYCTHHTMQCTLKIAHYTLYTTHYTLHCAALNSVYCRLQTVHQGCAICSVTAPWACSDRIWPRRPTCNHDRQVSGFFLLTMIVREGF